MAAEGDAHTRRAPPFPVRCAMGARAVLAGRVVVVVWLFLFISWLTWLSCCPLSYPPGRLPAARQREVVPRERVRLHPERRADGKPRRSGAGDAGLGRYCRYGCWRLVSTRPPGGCLGTGPCPPPCRRPDRAVKGCLSPTALANGAAGVRSIGGAPAAGPCPANPSPPSPPPPPLLLRPFSL